MITKSDTDTMQLPQVERALTERRNAMTTLRDGETNGYIPASKALDDQKRVLLNDTNLLGERLLTLKNDAAYKADQDKLNQAVTTNGADDAVVGEHPMSSQLGSASFSRPFTVSFEDTPYSASVGRLLTTSKGFGTMGNVYTVTIDQEISDQYWSGAVSKSLGTTGAIGTASGDPRFPLPDVQAPGVAIPQREPIWNVLGLFTRGGLPTTTKYVVELPVTGDVEERLERAEASEVQFKFDYKDMTKQFIGGYTELTKELVTSAPYMEDFVNGRMRQKVETRKHNQAVNGNGATGNIQGIWALDDSSEHSITQASIDANGWALYDGVFKSASISHDNGGLPTGLIMNTNTYEKFSQAEDSQGRRILTPGVGATNAAGTLYAGRATIHGLPVALNKGIPDDGVQVISGGDAAFYEAASIEVAVSDSHGQNFSSFVSTLRVSQECATAYFNRAAQVKYTITPGG